MIIILAPFYNEENVIHKFLESLFKVIAEIETHKFFVVLVNDGSTDNSLGEIELFKKNVKCNLECYSLP